jgi:hypothetical protein
LGGLRHPIPQMRQPNPQDRHSDDILAWRFGKPITNVSDVEISR